MKELLQKIDMKNRKTNLIVTIIILVLVLTIGVVTSIHFIQFRNYDAEFVLRDGVVGRVYKFSEFSKHLEGDVADSNIYEIQGTENTVAVVKANKASSYNTVDAIKSLNIVGVDGSTQATAAETTLGKTINKVADANTALLAVENGTYDVAIVSYSEAINCTLTDLTISDAVVEKVPSLLVIGGTHPNEPSGQMTATLFLENAVMSRGTLYVITELNRSAYSYSQPQEATTWYYHITTKNGKTRTFKYGSRATNTVDQWPTPDVYTHSSGQQLSSSEVRNINRAYPGSEEGTYTEQIAYAVTNFVNTMDVTMVIDLHEASPEYLTINAVIYHQDSEDLINQKGRAKAFKYEDGSKFDIGFEVSPTSMHGLTHRELGDYTNAYVFLCETSNASQGKIRGAFTEDLIKYTTPDKFYEALVEYDEKNGTELIYGEPVELSVRVARHTLSIISIIKCFNSLETTRVVTVTERDNVGVGGEHVGKFIINNIPSYEEITENGLGYYLLDPAE